jgi:hypothetical protein
VRIELDPARLRGPERSGIFGDSTLLHRLVGELPPTDDRSVIARIWAHAQAGLPELARPTDNRSVIAHIWAPEPGLPELALA